MYQQKGLIARKISSVPFEGLSSDRMYHVNCGCLLPKTDTFLGANLCAYGISLSLKREISTGK
jgi:hypothetical protein